MTFGERLILLRKENGFATRKKFAAKLDIPETTLRNYETNAREPGHTFLTMISNFFNVSTDYLLGLTEEKEKFSTHQLKSSEYNHVQKYRSLDSIGKETVDFILDREAIRSKESKEQKEYIIELENLSKEEHQRNTKTRLINYYYRLASAGTGQIIFDTPPTKRIEIPDIPKYRHVDYAIGVNGVSMEPTYRDNDTLLVEMTDEVDKGEVGIFSVDNNCYVKKLGDGELISLNHDFPNIPLNESSRCMGKVIDKLGDG